MVKRPIPVTILSYLLIAVGAIGFFYHLPEYYSRHSFASDDVWVLVVRLVAIVCGVFMLRGRDWARWLSMAWIAFHGVLSFFHSMREVAIHSLFLVVLAVLLFRPRANQFFRGACRMANESWSVVMALGTTRNGPESEAQFTTPNPPHFPQLPQALHTNRQPLVLFSGTS